MQCRRVSTSSLEEAKYLLKICFGGPLADKVNQGVLIGAGNFHLMSRQERQMILEYLQHVTADDVDEAVESFCSAFLPMHCKPVGGKLYRKGDFVAAVQQGGEIFFKIKNFFKLTMSINHLFLVTRFNCYLILVVLLQGILSVILFIFNLHTLVFV